MMIIRSAIRCCSHSTTLPRMASRPFCSAPQNPPPTWLEMSKSVRAKGYNDTVYVSGTCAPGETATEQMQNIFNIIEPALEAEGCTLKDIVKTTMFVADIEADWEEIGRAHGEILHGAWPANTLVGAKLLKDWMKVEVEVVAKRFGPLTAPH